MSEWRDIASAPKDGTRVLLFYPSQYGTVIVVGYWETQRYHRMPRPYWSNDSERIWGVIALRDNPPTHWMPLPAPPSEAQGVGS